LAKVPLIKDTNRTLAEDPVKIRESKDRLQKVIDDGGFTKSTILALDEIGFVVDSQPCIRCA